MNKKMMLAALLLVSVVVAVFGTDFEERITEKTWCRDYFNEVIYRKDRNILVEYQPRLKDPYFDIDPAFFGDITYWFEDPGKYWDRLDCIKLDDSEYGCYIRIGIDGSRYKAEKVVTDWYGSYYHEGVDFEGSVGTPIHSFICGKVVMMKNQKNKHYGLSVLIQKNEKEDGKNVYYLLGHLSEYASDLKIGSIVYPGKVIGTVGNSGNCYTDDHKITSEERAEGKGSHLHLSFYKTEKPISKLFVNDNFITYYMENEIFESDLFNPFSHNEGRNFK